MGLDYEILEEQYNKIAADKAAAEAREDLSDEERQNVTASFDRALAGIEEGIVALVKNTKVEIDSLIAGLEDKVKANEDYIKAAEDDLAKRKAELEEELAKENPDQGVVEAKQAQITALEKRIKSLKSVTRKVQKEIKEQKKLLIPLMTRFKDKVFTEQEIKELEKLDKKIKSGKALADKQKKETEEVIEEPAAVEEPVAEEPAAEEPVAEEPATEEPAAENIGGGNGNGARTTNTEETRGDNGSGTSAQPAAAESTEKTLYERKKDFAKIYDKAVSGKLLTAKEYDTLADIMSKPGDYKTYGITTGGLFNKGKVLLKAMGQYVQVSSADVIGAAQDVKVFNDEIKTSKESARSNGLIPTERAGSWRGIKSLLRSEELRFASEEILEGIAASADSKIEEARNTNATQVIYGETKTYTTALDGVLTNIKSASELQKTRIENFKKVMGTYKEVRRERGQKDFNLLDNIIAAIKKNVNVQALPEAEQQNEDFVERGEEKAEAVEETTSLEELNDQELEPVEVDEVEFDGYEREAGNPLITSLSELVNNDEPLPLVEDEEEKTNKDKLDLDEYDII